MACRGIQWVLGLLFAANVIALRATEFGSPRLVGRRDRLVNARGVEWHVRTAERRCVGSIRHGSDRRLGQAARAPDLHRGGRRWPVRRSGPGREVPCPGPCSLLTLAIGLRSFDRRSLPRRPWLALALIYLGTAALVGGCWYLRAYVHTGNPVYPYFRQVFGNSGLDEVLDPSKRPLSLSPLHLLLRSARCRCSPIGSTASHTNSVPSFSCSYRRSCSSACLVEYSCSSAWGMLFS